MSGQQLKNHARYTIFQSLQEIQQIKRKMFLKKSNNLEIFLKSDFDMFFVTYVLFFLSPGPKP